MRAKMKAATFVIATQRSGSTLLSRDIESLGGLGGPGEYFLKLLKDKTKTATEADVLACIEKGVRDDAPEVGAIKLMINYAPKVDALIRNAPPVDLNAALQNVMGWANARFDHVTWIILIRDDLLEQVISRSVSQMTGVWHRDASQSDPHEDMQLQRWQLNLRILENMHRAAIEQRALKRLAKTNSARCLVLKYADMCDDPLGSAEKIAKHAAQNGMQAKSTVPVRNLAKVIDQDKVDEIKKNFKVFMARQFKM